jgi:DNA-binding LacI/PurR family transcriptional regulator
MVAMAKTQELEAPDLKAGGGALVRRKPATLSDVAREAGVVAMTASRAINGSGYVSQEVRERVLVVARKLNYRPNMLARSLKGQRLKAVGIMLPDIANPFSAELVEGMKDVLEPEGYTPFIALAGRGVDHEREGLQSFVDHRVDGLLVATLRTDAGDDLLRDLSGQGIPMVTVGREVMGMQMDCVTADHWQGGFDVTMHLIELGHRLIGFVGIAADDALRLRRYQGYLAALNKAGLKIGSEYTVGPVHAPAFATQDDGYDGMMRLAKLDAPPTAVLARNDSAAIGVLRAAHTLGMKAPDDLSVAGFDNIPLAAFWTPALTTVAQPIREQGKLAARILLDKIEGKSTALGETRTMECELVVRESTGRASKQ